MRTDLPSMNPGKAMAQASHASNAFVHTMTRKAEIEDGIDIATDSFLHRFGEWTRQTTQGFGTVLVLGCKMTDIAEIDSKVFDIRHELQFDKVVDPTYPYIVNSEIKDLIDSDRHTMDPHELESGDYVCFREEITCAYLFGDKNSESIQNLVGHLKLHP